MRVGRFLLAAVCCGCAIPAISAPMTPGQRLERRLQAEFLKKAAWFTDYGRARDESARSGKPIFAYFTRSYAHCPKSTEVEEGPFARKEFEGFSKGFVLFCDIAARPPGGPESLFVQKGGTALPYFAFLDSDGNVIAKLEKPPAVPEFEEGGKRALRYLEVRGKAKEGDVSAMFALLEADLDMGYVPEEGISKRLDGILASQREKPIRKGAPAPLTHGAPAALQLDDLFDDLKRKLEPRLVRNEIRGVLHGMGADLEGQAEAGRRCYGMVRKERAPTLEGSEAEAFWCLVMDQAERVRDADTFERAMKAFEALAGGKPHAKLYLEGCGRRLAVLRVGDVHRQAAPGTEPAK